MRRAVAALAGYVPHTGSPQRDHGAGADQLVADIGGDVGLHAAADDGVATRAVDGIDARGAERAGQSIVARAAGDQCRSRALGDHPIVAHAARRDRPIASHAQEIVAEPTIDRGAHACRLDHICSATGVDEGLRHLDLGGIGALVAEPIVCAERLWSRVVDTTENLPHQAIADVLGQRRDGNAGPIEAVVDEVVQWPVGHGIGMQQLRSLRAFETHRSEISTHRLRPRNELAHLRGHQCRVGARPRLRRREREDTRRR